MDLRAKVNNILARWGHDILLQRRLTATASGVYGSDYTYAEKLERHTTRHRLPGEGSGLTGVVQEQAEGIDAEVDLIYYFKWDVNPKSGDRIYDQNPTGVRRYVIDWSQPMRYQNGRIEYWIVGASMESEGT